MQAVHNKAYRPGVSGPLRLPESGTWGCLPRQSLHLRESAGNENKIEQVMDKQDTGKRRSK